jgi:carbon-monoxide dehydrogenase catalytic subunit
MALCAMAGAGGLGESIAELPVAGAAPEYMSEKAIAIGQYFVASGVYTIFGVTFPMVEDTKFHDLMFGGLEKRGMGKWGFEPDPHAMAKLMIEHIDKKRGELGLDKAKERVLVDMEARRAAEA